MKSIGLGVFAFFLIVAAAAVFVVAVAYVIRNPSKHVMCYTFVHVCDRV